MPVQAFRNFLTPEECATLNQVVADGIDTWMGPGITHGGIPVTTRLTSRMHMGNHQYPDIVHEISNRVREFMGIADFPLITGHGSEGVVVSYTMPGGDVYEHRDPRSNDGLPTYRCNILTQAATAGAELYVNGKLIEVGVGDLHCYMVSELAHRVTTAQGTVPRIMWMFGAHIPREHWAKFGLIAR